MSVYVGERSRTQPLYAVQMNEPAVTSTDQLVLHSI